MKMIMMMKMMKVKKMMMMMMMMKVKKMMMMMMMIAMAEIVCILKNGRTHVITIILVMIMVQANHIFI